MARWHDPEAAVCSCFACTEQRYQRDLAATEEAALEREEAELAARAERELQLRLPMRPIPHLAHQYAPPAVQAGGALPPSTGR